MIEIELRWKRASTLQVGEGATQNMATNLVGDQQMVTGRRGGDGRAWSGRRGRRMKEPTPTSSHETLPVAVGWGKINSYVWMSCLSYPVPRETVGSVWWMWQTVICMRSSREKVVGTQWVISVCRHLAEKISLANICIRGWSEGQWSPARGVARDQLLKGGHPYCT